MLHLLGERAKVAWRHQPAAHPWAARRRQRRAHARDARKVGLIVVERVGVRAAEREVTGLGVLEAERLPVEQLGEALGAVALVDTLATGLAGEREELVGLRTGRRTSAR